MSDFPFLGSCSTRTLRTEDTLPAFCVLLTNVLKWALDSGDYPQNQVETHTRRLDAIERASEEDEEYFDDEESSYDLEWLSDTLNEYAPEGVHFGSHEGDGSNFGYWEHGE